LGLHHHGQDALTSGGDNFQYISSAVVACTAPQELGRLFELARQDVEMVNGGSVAAAL